MEHLDEQTQQPEQEVVEQQEQTAPEQPQQNDLSAQQKQEQTAKEENLRRLRYRAEEADRLQKERDDAMLRLREYEARYSQQPQQQTQPDYDFNVDDDGLVEGKHIKKMYNHIKKLESQLQQQSMQSTNMAVETRLKMQYPDIDSVLSKENIDMLRATEPELVQTLDADNNTYTKAVTAYKFIKNSGIYKDPNMYKDDIDRIQANAKKPKPLSSIPTQTGSSPLHSANAFANGLTEDLKKRLYAEMMEAKKNR